MKKKSIEELDDQSAMSMSQQLRAKAAEHLAPSFT
jgi:hypothetical protein